MPRCAIAARISCRSPPACGTASSTSGASRRRSSPASASAGRSRTRSPCAAWRPRSRPSTRPRRRSASTSSSRSTGRATSTRISWRYAVSTPRSRPPRAPHWGASSVGSAACRGTTPTAASTSGCARTWTRASSSRPRSTKAWHSCPATRSRRRAAAATRSASRTAPRRPTASPRGCAGSAARMTVSALANRSSEDPALPVRASPQERSDSPRPAGRRRSSRTGTTLSQKIWDRHVVRRASGSQMAEPDVLYVDLHLVHEVTSPQAFDGLRVSGRAVRRPDLTLATMDHNTPTDDRTPDDLARKQIEALVRNCDEFGVHLYPLGSRDQGIVHVISPQLGLTQPGMVIVCGDSHTSTHGAFGAIAFGIGTSEVEHVLATQTIAQARPATMAITVDGDLPAEVSAKDVILGIIARIGVGGGAGAIVEYRGSAIRALSMEGRMTVCNMSIEAGARAGMVAPDDTTFAYVEGRPFAPKGADWQRALDEWRSLAGDDDATFDREVRIDAAELRPYVTWGTNPAQSAPIDGVVPDPDAFDEPSKREAARRALAYQALRPGTRVRDIGVDAVFIGSCTNARIEDLRAAAGVVAGRRVRSGVRALVVPGSARVKEQAEREGLDRVFRDAGFEWRNAGCSMCLGMNADVLGAGERCAATSNRTFGGRPGRGGRTHLMSPVVAAATAVKGSFALPSDLA